MMINAGWTRSGSSGASYMRSNGTATQPCWTRTPPRTMPRAGNRVSSPASSRSRLVRSSAASGMWRASRNCRSEYSLFFFPSELLVMFSSFYEQPLNHNILKRCHTILQRLHQMLWILPLLLSFNINKSPLTWKWHRVYNRAARYWKQIWFLTNIEIYDLTWDINSAKKETSLFQDPVFQR